MLVTKDCALLQRKESARDQTDWSRETAQRIARPECAQPCCGSEDDRREVYLNRDILVRNLHDGLVVQQQS